MLILQTMNLTEKLTMMEALWNDLSRDPAALASPKWHGDALKEAEHAVAENHAGFVA